MAMPPPDLLDRIIGAQPSAAISQLRAQRPDIVRHTEGSHDALLSPREPHGLALAQRALVALRVAERSGHAGLAAHYRGLLAERGGAPSDARTTAILRQVELVTTTPASATRADIDALRDAGLTARDIVALTQIVAFVSYQVRAAAGLALLAREMAP